MIQGIQNVSFGGAQSKLVNKAARKVEEAYVSASSNLAGTVNEARAERMLRDAKFASDKNTLAARITSLIASKRNVPNEFVAKSAESANNAKAAISEFTFFG